MKTIEEFLKEIESSEELKKEYDTITDDAGLDAFLKKLDCEATADEFIKYIDDYAGSEGAVSDDAAEAAAGGLSPIGKRREEADTLRLKYFENINRTRPVRY